MLTTIILGVIIIAVAAAGAFVTDTLERRIDDLAAELEAVRTAERATARIAQRADAATRRLEATSQPTPGARRD